ncbi:Hypothetical predicted protein [Cloeon dipterum]|uniref:Peptidase S1 domain-containing protein n=2 Tax=Cloeon dipterum TaxID=197152 RepID=A0A8S1BUW0_9INSE|nr:Hypothetical predicted protein [Cloeon dipterum]
MSAFRSFLLGFQILILFSAASVNAATKDNKPSIFVKNNGQIVQPVHIKNTNNIGAQIIGGSQAAAGVFPWHAWLDILQIGSVGGYLCGASLIAPKYAMSACHCIMPIAKFKHDVVLGTVNIRSPTAGYVRKTIAKPLCHENYVASTAQNDVSLLPFDSPVTATSNIQWINLPQPSLASADLVGTKANVSGFGRISDSNQMTSNTLKYATLTITTDASCTTEYGANWYFSNVMMCAKAPAADQADCNGDSGGALIYNNGSAWVQIGIVSWGGNSCQTTSSVYTRVTSFVSWITNKMSALDGGVTSAPSTTSTRSSTTKKPTTPTTTKPPQCALKDLKNLQTKCCSPPAKDLLAKTFNKAVETTCKKVGGDNTAFNFFVLNKLQNAKKNNSLDLTDSASMAKQLAKAACYISCFLNQTKAVDSTGVIDVSALTALLIANQVPSGPWDEIITEAVSNCTSLVSELPLPDLQSGKLRCNPSGALVVQCVLARIIDKCPSRVTNTLCKTDYTLFDQCKNFITDALMNSP